MKLKMIAAAVAGLASAGAFAAPLPSTTTPDVVFYVGGASAQKQAIEASVANQICATPADAAWFVSTNATRTDTNTGGSVNFKEEGMLCLSKASGLGTYSNKNVLVVYNSFNGSTAGLNQALSSVASPTEAEATVLSLPCADGGASTTTINGIVARNVSCVATREVKLGLSDVHPTESVPGALDETQGRTIANMKVQFTGLQGFGVIAGLSGTTADGGNTFNAVNNSYRALQEQNVADGLLPSSCTPVGITNATAACQPTIGKAQYAALISAEGVSYQTAATLLPAATGVAAMPLVVERRVNLSGTQASSNIFFAQTPCQDSVGGNLTPNDDSADIAGVYEVRMNPQTGDVRNNVAGGKAKDGSTASLNFGVISLDNAGTFGTSTKWRFVRLDGQSPDVNNDGTLDAKNRHALVDGAWPFALQMTAIYPKTTTVTTNPLSTTGGVFSADDKTLADTIIAGMTNDIAAINLTGVAHITGSTPSTKQARYKRFADNNCFPLSPRF